MVDVIMKEIKKGRDITTTYSNSIEEIYTDFFARLVEGNMTTNQKSNYVMKLAQLYRLENNALKLSFSDKKGGRCLNSICGYLKEGEIIQQSFFLLTAIKRHYNSPETEKEFEIILAGLPEREITLISGLFKLSGSREILARNEYDYCPYDSYKYSDAEDKRYCETVLELIKEIAIRTYNYSKYRPETDEDVRNLYVELADRYEKHVEEANKNCFQKVIDHVKFAWKDHKESHKERY